MTGPSALSNPSGPSSPSGRIREDLRGASSILLRWGSRLASILTALGLAGLLLDPGSFMARAQDHDLIGFREGLTALALIKVGILTYLALPILEVFLLVGIFARHRDHLYTLIGLLILALMLFSVISRG